MSYLKRDPVTSAEQVKYIFKKLYHCAILSKIHPIGQIINYDNRRSTEQMLVQVHVLGAPTINEDYDTDDSKVVNFIEK